MTPQELNARRTPEKRKIDARNAGIASGISRANKATFHDITQKVLDGKIKDSHKSLSQIKTMLKSTGFKEKDHNYKVALVVSMILKAIKTGNTKDILNIAGIAGEISADGTFSSAEIENIIDVAQMPVMLPDNGRDKRPEGVIGPQAGPQTAFMASPADIIIYGGAAGGGKTFALLLEVLRHKDVPGFGAVIFRHNANQITAQGGLWDASHKIYDSLTDAESKLSPRPCWEFRSGARVSFAHIERDDNLKAWQGSEIAYIGFDELTHFTRRQFIYMLSRNRSTCGIRPYMRATCNPDSDSWVADFISWWINPDTGYPIKERSGVIKYMTVQNDNIIWGDSPEELAETHGIDPADCKSFTFIASRLEDNKILMDSDPGYLSNLKALGEVDKERLLYGNWKIKPAAGLYYKRTQVNMIEALPSDIIMWARGWDLAATSQDESGEAAYTAGVLIGKTKGGRYVIADVINKRLSASEVRTLISITAQTDKAKYGRVIERLPQDPGQAGKEQAQSYIKMLAGFLVKAIPESGSKESRAEPLAAQWQAGNVDVLVAEWNEEYFNQLESFPESKFKDMVDASSSAFNEIENGATYSAPPSSTGLGKSSYWRR